MTNFSAMSYEKVLKELRCETEPQHRVDAAKFLLEKTENPERIAYLVNCVLYDPLPEVRSQVKALLYEVYGNELESIIKIEGQDGTPIEDPWMTPCSMVKVNPKNTATLPQFEDIEMFVSEKDVDALHDALRDPLDVYRRISAIQALLKCNNEGTPEILARAVLHDPNENVQQCAYQSLYDLIGDEKAEALLEKIGALIMDEEEPWLLTPDYFDEYQHELENEEQDYSPFGINKADQVRGLTNLFTSERNPQKRIAIINALAQSNDFNVNESIARVGLFDADKTVREYAKT
ncbi:HEAT repeat domain-containing protein, partial [bacterium]|nr:HEAT repeat domain-containing protein [bacterium]